MRLPCLCVYRNMDVIIRGRAGEVRFEGFGRLRGQNGPPDRARSAGEQTKSRSWGGPFWRIWAAQRTKRSTRERKEHRSTATGERRTQNKRTAGQARFEEFRRLSYQGGPPETARSTAKQTRTGRAGRSVLKDLGRWAAKTDSQKEQGAQLSRWRADELGRSVLMDLHSWAGKTEHQTEKGAQKQSHGKKEQNSWASPLWENHRNAKSMSPGPTRATQGDHRWHKVPRLPRKTPPRVTTEGPRHSWGNASASQMRKISASQTRSFPVKSLPCYHMLSIFRWPSTLGLSCSISYALLLFSWLVVSTSFNPPQIILFNWF